MQFVLELQITQKACQAIRNLPELLGSCSITADSASPVSGGADKGHIDGQDWEVSKNIERLQEILVIIQ